MTMKKFLIIFILLSIKTLAFNQVADSIIFKKHKEVGLNLTGLIAQFVPFGNNNPRMGPFIYSYKSYSKKRTAFRLGLGVNSFDFLNEENLSFNLRIGYEKRKLLTNRWSYTYGIDGMILVGNDFANINDGSNEINGALGIGLPVGIEYSLNDYIYLSVETNLFFGLGSSIINILTIPPTGLFLNTRF